MSTANLNEMLAERQARYGTFEGQACSGGGMTTEKYIRDRCEEVGDCWIWQQAVNSCGYPRMGVPGRGTLSVRRLAAELAGMRVEPGQPVEATCGEKLCVNPAHMRPTTRKAVAGKAAQQGAFSSMARAAKIAEARRLGSKLTDEQVAYIRASAAPHVHIAARFGVSKQYVSAIRRNMARKDYRNPFAALTMR